MNKNYVTPKKTLLHSGLLVLGMLTLVGFKGPGPGDKVQQKATTAERTAELFQVNVNFQDKATIPPAGYLKDYGKEFGFSSATTLETEYDYGWKRLSDDTPFDVSEDAAGNKTGVGRNRITATYATASEQEKLEGTLVHFQGNDVFNIQGTREWKLEPRGNEVYWELAVLEGDHNYTVEIGLGDKNTTYIDSRHSATVEGYTILSAFKPTPGQTKTATMIVKVTDGMLTVKGTGGFNSKIDYIKVTENVAEEPTTTDEVLSFTPAASELNINLGDNGPGMLTTTLTGTGATDIGLAIDNNTTVLGGLEETGVNDWISLPTTNVVGDFTFPLTASTIAIDGKKPTRQSTIYATAAGFKPAKFQASLLVGCTPLSTLACDQLVKAMPVNITFDGSEDGLEDATGNSVGFTLAAPITGTRLSEDPVATYNAVNGYEPSKLNVDQGMLSITATKGLALGNPDVDKANANKQVNTLGVGLTGITTPIQLETKLIGITTGTDGFQQTGLHFSVNQDNYIKLVVIGDNIELRKEVDGVTAAGEKNTDNIIAKSLGLIGQDVSLALVIDPTAMTAKGFYAINDGAYIAIEKDGKTELSLPQALLAGREVSTDITGVSLAGVFASYNKADTDFVADFDYFNVVAANLSIDSNSLDSTSDIVLYPNPATSEINVQMGQNVDAVKNIIIYDIQGRAVSTFEPSTVRKSSGFKLPTANLKSGIYFVQLQNENGENKQVRFIANN